MTCEILIKRQRILSILCVLLVAGVAGNGVHGQVNESPLFDADTRVEKIFDQGFFLEGPAMAPDGSVYFSDLTFTSESGMLAGRIWRYDPVNGQTTIFRSPSGMANGIIFDPAGQMIIAEGADYGGRRIIRTDLKSGNSTIVAGLYNCKPFNSPNDLTMDRAGRIYFSDPRYVGHEAVEQPVQGVYRIDPGGKVTLIIANAGKPNGIALSPDQKRLYVASMDDGGLGESTPWLPSQPGLQALLAYPLDENGNPGAREVLIDFGDDSGPDGMTIDSEGNLYLARPAKTPGIYIYSASGEFRGMIALPESPSNVTFGTGQENHVLYITAGQGLYRFVTRANGTVPNR